MVEHLLRGKDGLHVLTDPKVAGRTAEQPGLQVRWPVPPLDNLMEVQMLVEQVKGKTADIRAMAHSTVGKGPA